MMPMAKDKKKSYLSIAISMGKPKKTMGEEEKPALPAEEMADKPEEVEPAVESKAYDKFELEAKARTLMEAEEIKSDSELMDALQPYLSKKASALEGMKSHVKGIDDLKAIGKSKGVTY